MKKLISKSTKVTLIVSLLSLLLIHQTGKSQTEFDFNRLQTINKNKIKAPSCYDSAALDSFIVETMAEYHIPGLSACIVKDDEIMWTGSYGYADIEQNKEVTDSTIFLLASISKTFTATALMQLWEDGLFELDDDINDYLPSELLIHNPYYPNDKITFRHLLTHTSSIAELSFGIPQLYWGMDSPISLFLSLVDYLTPEGSNYTSNRFKNSAPGTTFEYSNIAIALVGYLVESISNTPFPDYCKENIFTPLGMNETSWFLADFDVDKIAVPYEYSDGSYTAYEHYGHPMYPAAQLRTSATQLARYLTACMQKGEFEGNKILDGTTVELMMTPEVESPYYYYPNSITYFGLVWQLGPFSIPDYIGEKWYSWHSGGWRGSETLFGFCNETKTGIILLANGRYRGEEWFSYDIWNEILKYAFLQNKIYANAVNLSSNFIQANVDSITVTAQFVNQKNHNFISNIIFTSSDSTMIDSVSFYDDGKHNDGLAGDGTWGNTISPIPVEKYFSISVSVTDLDSTNYDIFYHSEKFTTIGPIVVESHTFSNNDTEPNPGNSLSLKLTLKNNSTYATASDITAKISSLDSFSVVQSDNEIAYGDIAPGESANPTNFFFSFFGIKIEEDCPPNTDVSFQVDIASHGYIFWKDTLKILVLPTGVAERETNIPDKFALFQNYPNPFNPRTTISYQLPVTSQVELTIYSITGQKISTLVSEQQPSGNHKFEWDASDFSSGIYFFQLEAETFSHVRKMILVR